MSKEVTCGILLPLRIKPEHSRDWEEFVVKEGPPGVKHEADTIHWFGTQEGSNEYGIIDTFPHEDGRKAHLRGAVAKAVFGHKDWFAEEPAPVLFNVLAATEAPRAEFSDNKAGVTVGLRIIMRAKQNKIDDLRDFLTNALPAIEGEPATIHWVAFEIPGTGAFGIVDSFPNEASRETHINGKVYGSLFANVDALLDGPPDIVKTTILAGNIN